MGLAALAEGAAIAATVVAVVGTWAQVRRTLTSGDARGVSVTTPSLGVATELAWVVYAVHEGLWSALPEAALMVAANVVLAVVLWRAGSAMCVAALAALAWMAVLGTTAALGGPAALAALLGFAYAVQVTPAVWCAYRTRTPVGVARATWLLLALESALWSIYGASHSDPAMLTFAAVGLTASAAVLLRTRRPFLTTLGRAPPRPSLRRIVDFRFGLVTTPIRDVINRPDVLGLFTRQHFVASCDQLASLGVTKAAVYRARGRGLLVAVSRGVVALAGVELSFEGRVLALQLTAGATAFVSGPSAGVLYGLRSMPRERLEVTIKERRRATIPAPHRLVRTSWIDESRDVCQRFDGIRIATPLRMLFGLAEQFNQHRFERAAEDVWHKGLVSPEEAAKYLGAIRRSGRTGVIRYEAWLERVSFRTRPSQSGLELRLLELIERVGLPTPVRQFPLLLANGELIHLDIAWPAARLAVEPGHSWWHGGDLRQRQDQARDRACAVVGWHIVRYDETAADDPMTTARELLALYRRRVLDLTGSSET